MYLIFRIWVRDITDALCDDNRELFLHTQNHGAELRHRWLQRRDDIHPGHSLPPGGEVRVEGHGADIRWVVPQHRALWRRVSAEGRRADDAQGTSLHPQDIRAALVQQHGLCRHLRVELRLELRRDDRVHVPARVRHTNRSDAGERRGPHRRHRALGGHQSSHVPAVRTLGQARPHIGDSLLRGRHYDPDRSTPRHDDTQRRTDRLLYHIRTPRRILDDLCVASVWRAHRGRVRGLGAWLHLIMHRRRGHYRWPSGWVGLRRNG